MTQRVLGPSGSRRRKTRLLVLTALAASAFTVLFVAASGATLSGGSTFESGDGNLLVNTTGLHDWNSPVEAISCGTAIPGGGANCGLDLVKDKNDNSLGQGAKEDDPAPSVVSGAIPPSKDDLSRFYVNKERVGANEFLYLAWERSNLLGSAHMDFEFNQDSTLSANGVTPVRTAGDLLIDFDFGGSGVPVLAKHTWITSGNAASDCEASNTLPCWDKAVNLGAFAEAQVNSVPVDDTNPPDATRTLDGNTKNGINSTFGEAGINLTGSGILPATSCKHFGAAYLKSRSSGNSFSSELKDFVAPIPVNIANCGEIKVIKTTDPADQDQNFTYTTNMKTIGGSNASCTGPTITSGAFTLNAGAAATKTEDCKDLLPSSSAGDYTVGEDLPTSPWVFTSLTCTSDKSSSTIVKSGRTATITLAAEDLVTCTYLNTKPKASPGATSAPNLIPNDSVTVTNFDGTGSKDGVLTVALWDNSACSTASGGTKLYEKTFTVTGAGPYVTTNDGTGSSPAGYKISGNQTGVSYYWSEVYAGDTRNNGFSYCASPNDEFVTVTIKGKTS